VDDWDFVDLLSASWVLAVIVLTWDLVAALSGHPAPFWPGNPLPSWLT
jgi:hypothetical protein